MVLISVSALLLAMLVGAASVYLFVFAGRNTLPKPLTSIVLPASPISAVTQALPAGLGLTLPEPEGPTGVAATGGTTPAAVFGLAQGPTIVNQSGQPADTGMGSLVADNNLNRNEERIYAATAARKEYESDDHEGEGHGKSKDVKAKKQEKPRNVKAPAATETKVCPAPSTGTSTKKSNGAVQSQGRGNNGNKGGGQPAAKGGSKGSRR